MTPSEEIAIMVTMEDVRDFLSITNEKLLDEFDKHVYEVVKKLINATSNTY